MKFTGCISRVGGHVVEVFLDAEKPNSGVADLARDIAIAASLALQYGCPADTLRKALTRLHDGRGAGPLSVLLDALDAEAP